MPDEPKEPADLAELIEQSNRIKGMRREIISGINDLFATIAEVAENEKEGKYGALIKLATRMQDERDIARRDLKQAKLDLAAAVAKQREAHTRLTQVERDRAEATAAMVGALTIRNAAVLMRDRLHQIRTQGMSNKEDAKMAAAAHEIVVKFDEATAGYIHGSAPVSIHVKDDKIKVHLDPAVPLSVDSDSWGQKESREAIEAQKVRRATTDLAPVPDYVKRKRDQVDKRSRT